MTGTTSRYYLQILLQELALHNLHYVPHPLVFEEENPIR